MSYRIVAVSLSAMALAAFVSAAGTAGDKSTLRTHDGKIVSVTSGKLVMTGKDGKEHGHTVAAEAKVCCDGVACKLADLKEGLRIRVTTGDGDVVTRIEALNRNERFEAQADTQDGKIVSVTGNKLIMTDKDGKEASRTVTADAKVRCDGTACKLADLKTGQRIRVTTQDSDRTVITQIEALNKNEKFETRN